MKLLLLAGSGEARRLAGQLAGEPGVTAIASLAGATRAPIDLPIARRVGGFGGAVGFKAWLEAEKIDAVLDATHPFAARISARSAAICRARGLSFLHLSRPPWQPGPGDRWHFVDDETQAAAHIPEGAVVFLGTGRKTLMRFANLSGRQLICRRIDTPKNPFPLANGEYLLGRPPFSITQEIELFERLKIDWLVVKNAGGETSRSKLDAARALGLPVLMIKRPAPPDALRVETVAQAMAWVRRLVHVGAA